VATGQAHYIRVDAGNLHAAMVASCALPFLYRTPAQIDGERYVDGGVADSIPVRRAYAMGARDITVVLSRPQGYRKPARPARLSTALLQLLLREQPGLARQVQARAADYNASLDFIENPPADCRVRLIAPPEHFAVRRLSMALERLECGYAQGRAAAEDYLNAT
jgi:predicted patatin/cPLA2 family phospholipase